MNNQTESLTHALKHFQEGARFWNAGPPYLATVQDMYKIAVKWTEYAPRIYDTFPHLYAEVRLYARWGTVASWVCEFGTAPWSVSLTHCFQIDVWIHRGSHSARAAAYASDVTRAFHNCYQVSGGSQGFSNLVRHTNY